MADIDVVKKGSRTWLWIVAAIALVLLLWFLMAGTGSEPRTGLNRTFEATEPATPPSLFVNV